MRLDRYFPEQRRRRFASGSQKRMVVGIVVALHLCLGAGLFAWSVIRDRNAPPEYVIRFFDIATFPLPPAPVARAAPDTAATTPPQAPALPERGR